MTTKLFPNNSEEFRIRLLNKIKKVCRPDAYFSQEYAALLGKYCYECGLGLKDIDDDEN